MLNEKQQQIVEQLDGQLLVVACPGSGKTTAMIARAHALIEKGVSPVRILVITFTKEAAVSMEKKYKSTYGEDGICFGTIHSICYRILKNTAGYTDRDLLLESEKWSYFSSVLYKKVSPMEMEEFIKGLITEISYVKNRRISPEQHRSQVTDREQFINLYNGYETYKKEQSKIDFDDMLILTRRLLMDNPDVLEEYRKRYSYIMIDEYQDTNRVQADIFYMIAGETGNICVVGDDDQSIYGFRSADSSIMLDFPKQFKHCKTVYLDTNYRSEPEIIKSAGKLISCNRVRFQKEFLGAKTGKGYIDVHDYPDAAKQRDAVIEKLKTLHETGIPYEEMSVLYRTNKQNYMYVQKLMKDEIPFYTTEAVKDYHNEFVFCDIMAYARLAYGNHKRGDLQRILNRPSRYLKSDAFRSCTFNLTDMLACANSLSNASMARVNVMNLWADIELLSETTTPKDFVNRLYYGIGYKQSALSFADYCGKDKAETEELLNVLQKEAEDFATMDEWAAFAKEYSGKLQEKRKKKEGICLSTYHSSKGLEWEYVFLIDCNEDVTPFSKAETPEEIEEERRLFYVAFTRAKKGVSLSYINSTGTKKMFVSRFLQEMELTRSATVKNADGRSVDTDRARDLAKKKHPHYGSISPYPYSY